MKSKKRDLQFVTWDLNHRKNQSQSSGFITTMKSKTENKVPHVYSLQVVKTWTCI